MHDTHDYQFCHAIASYQLSIVKTERKCNGADMFDDDEPHE